MKINIQISFDNTAEDFRKLQQVQAILFSNPSQSMVSELISDLSPEEQEECDRRCQETYQNGSTPTLDYMIGNQSISNAIRYYFTNHPNSLIWDCLLALWNEPWIKEHYANNEQKAYSSMRDAIKRLAKRGELVKVGSGKLTKYSAV